MQSGQRRSVGLAFFFLALMACNEVPKVEEAKAPTTPDAATSTTAPHDAARSKSAPTRTTPIEASDDGDTHADAGATSAPSAKGACDAPGAAVYAFENDANAWRYAIDDSRIPEGFTPRGLAFRGAPASATEATTPLYLLKNEANGDYLVTTVPTEGANFGYGPVEEIARVFISPVPGAVPLIRYLQETPALRHLVSIDGNVDGWEAEPARGYVCPR